MAVKDFPQVFQKLKALLEPYAGKMVLSSDTDSGYYLDTRFIMSNKQPLFFGAVKIRKSYVSFYLMPLYACPELLNQISPDLKKRMQGLTCFNFSGVDEGLFAELAELTQAGYQAYQKKGYIPL